MNWICAPIQTSPGGTTLSDERHIGASPVTSDNCPPSQSGFTPRKFEEKTNALKTIQNAVSDHHPRSRHRLDRYAYSGSFTVVNEIDKTANIYIYTGADSVCSLEEKLKKAVAGETDTYGCTGQGKGQCKIEVYVGGDQICKNKGDTCNNNAMKVKGGSTVSIAKPGEDYVCHID